MPVSTKPLLPAKFHEVVFRVEGRPQTQGSTKGFAIPAKGTRKARVVITSTNKNLKPWREMMKDAFCQQVVSYYVSPPPEDYADKPYFPACIGVALLVIMPRLACHAKMKPGTVLTAPLSGDLDKFQRAVGDSLTDAKIIKDDRYIEQWIAFKRYAAEDEEPGVIVTVSGWIASS